MKIKPIRHVSPLLKSKKPIELYGVVPFHAARVLHKNYQGYPEPKKHASTNQLHHWELFTGESQTKRK